MLWYDWDVDVDVNGILLGYTVIFTQDLMKSSPVQLCSPLGITIRKKKSLKNASNWGSGMISVVSIPKFQYIYIYMLVGGWAYPSEKYEFVSRDDDIHTNLWKVIKIMFQTTNQYISWIKNSIKPNHPWVIPMISPCHISDGESGGAFLDQHESRLMTYVP